MSPFTCVSVGVCICVSVGVCTCMNALVCVLFFENAHLYHMIACVVPSCDIGWDMEYVVYVSLVHTAGIQPHSSREKQTLGIDEKESGWVTLCTTSKAFIH